MRRKCMFKMRGFESERIIKIINAVRKHECLWNVNSSEYGKRDRLERAWHEVAQEIGKSDIFCREKWRNVRTGFLRSIQHEIHSSDQDDPATDPNDSLKRKRFYLYDQMAFILPSVKTLEQSRKKRKLSRDRKSILDTDDADGGDSSNLPEYDELVAKFEPRDGNEEEVENESEEELEHHTLLINGDVYNDQEADDNRVSNIEEILREMQHNTATRLTNSSSNKTHQTSSAIVHNEGNAIDSNINHGNSSTSTKVIRLIGEQMNDEFCSKSNDTHEKTHSEYISNQPQRFCQRQEQQLLNFFRSCIDDILSLSKPKQRLFKKRMLDVIGELHHDS